jgi:hypothetical protein
MKDKKRYGMVWYSRGGGITSIENMGGRGGGKVDWIDDSEGEYVSE